jgi:quinone-modifying oxidoreductase subunit QmoC
MAEEILPSAEFRAQLQKRGGATASRCYQCATCSSVCQLAPDGAPFPRKQMHYVQWGLGDRLASDPAVWLCHYCNDCTTRCPRDAKPGDVMQAARALTVETLAAPRFMGKLVGRAKVTWPLLLGVPFAFWVVVLYAINGLTIPEAPLVYDLLVPHWLIYVVFFPVTGLVLLASLVSGLRFWKLIGKNQQRTGSFIGNVIPAAIEVGIHSRFAKCGTAGSRRWGHFFLMWGFIGALIATTLAIVALYLIGTYPLPLDHPFKYVGNIAALLLLVGGIWLWINRMRGGERTGTSTAFDNFFLYLVLLVIFTGIFTEIGRFFFPPALACWIYIVHLTSILTLFVTFPYSKFAHLIYRTLAMVHERMAGLKPSK